MRLRTLTPDETQDTHFFSQGQQHLRANALHSVRRQKLFVLVRRSVLLPCLGKEMSVLTLSSAWRNFIAIASVVLFYAFLFLMLSLSVFYKSALRNSSFHGGEDVVGVEVWLIFSCLFIPIMTSILNRIVLSRSIHGQLTSWIDATIIVAFATAPVIAYSIRM